MVNNTSDDLSDDEFREELEVIQYAIDEITMHEAELIDMGDVSISIDEFELRQSLISPLYVKVSDAFSKARSSLSTADRINWEDKVKKFKKDFIALSSSIRGRIRELSQVNSPEQNQPTRSTSVKVPKIEIPTFDGAYENWVKFRDLFVSLVHQNKSLSNVEKFHYLEMSMKLPATHCNVLKNYSMCSENYEDAWKAVCSRYDDKRRIVAIHAAAIFNMKKMTSETSLEIRRILDTCSSNLSALRQQGYELDDVDNFAIMIVIQMVLPKLDDATLKEWRKFIRDDCSTWRSLHEFLIAQWKSLEDISPSRKAVAAEVKTSSRSSRTMVSNNSQSDQKCSLCDETHNLWKCGKFKELSVDERQKLVRDRKLCLNCLMPNHRCRDCPSKFKCSKCSKSHHSLLHYESSRRDSDAHSSSTSPVKSNLSPEVEPFKPFNLTKTTNASKSLTFLALETTFLSTVEVEIEDDEGETHVIRGFLDPGSDTNHLTAHAVRLLKLPCQDACITLTGIGEKTSIIRHTTNAVISSRYGDFKRKLHFSVLPSLTGNLPSHSIDLSEVQIPPGYFLADRNFHKSGPIDILLSNDVFCDALLGEKVTLTSGPKMIHTKFGWIIGGTIRNPKHDSPRSYLSCFNQSGRIQVDEIDRKLDKFFEMEEFDSSKPSLTNEERYCEEIFKRTTTRDESGRFVVQLPLKYGHHKLGNNLKNAYSLIHAVETRRKRDEVFNHLYVDYMEDFIKTGHMEEVKPISGEFAHYLPHHGVLKMSSTSTKLRPVCNASSISESGISLNDVLCKGPTVQPESIDILMRGRENEFVMMGDITKMYRQIWVHPSHRNLLRLLWRSDPENESIKHYQMNTVTFGTASAPYLATRSLLQLAIDNEEKFPEAAAIIKNSFYVDDLFVSFSSAKIGIKVMNEIREILTSAGMILCKLASNSSEVLQSLPKELLASNMDDDDNSVIKTLGIMLDLKNDQFSYQLKPMKDGKVTKASVLSEIASIYDPIGWIGPVVLKAKLFMKRLWLLKLEWNEELPDEEQENWKNFREHFPTLSDVKINRHCYVRNPAEIEIHGFCDASIEAYGAAVYARSVDSDGNVQVSLICAKSRVAPSKQKSLARLELCGALLLAKLVARIVKVLSAEVKEIVLWSDSTIVLNWLTMMSSSLQTFVGNRVAAVQELSENVKWKHIPGDCNPADIISRGLMPEEIIECGIWWNGPKFLKSLKPSWPVSIITLNPDDPEVKIEVKARKTMTMIQDRNLFEKVENRYSEHRSVVKMMALIRRFPHNIRMKLIKGERRIGPVTMQEREEAERSCMLTVQKMIFSEEYEVLKRQKEIRDKTKDDEQGQISDVKIPQISPKSPLISLMPFLGDDGLIRVGGRLQKCDNLTYDQKHQIILPNCRYTEMLVRKLHQDHAHAGPLTLCNIVRQEFWPLKLRRIIKSVTRRCLTCYRVKPTDTNQLMAPLPKARVTMQAPFSFTAVDYAGYYYIRSGTTRNAPKVKTYVAMFKCMSTGAIHLDLARDLSTQGFISTLDRFVSRRGLCVELFTDNATCFEGADSELRKIIAEMDPSLKELCEERRIIWNFTTPRASHAGGIYESGIKSMKFHLKRVMGDTCFTFEQFQTVLCKIEAILNSRPITPISDDPNDLQALTPGHFLIGRPLVAKPERNLLPVNTSRLDGWEKVQQAQQIFWNRWYHEYLHTIQTRPKNFREIVEFKVGDMVLLKDSNLPPMKWMMGRIMKLFPDKYKVVRNVRVKTSVGEKDRHVKYLCLLPIENPSLEAGQCVPDGN